MIPGGIPKTILSSYRSAYGYPISPTEHRSERTELGKIRISVS
jgi:hypothetical protein